MGITRSGPVLNMDTEQPLVMKESRQRFTRGQAHRLLNANNVPHDASAGLDTLLYLIQMHNIQPAFVPPGKMGYDENKVVQLPNNVPKLRQLCKAKGIQFKNTDKMADLKRRLQEG